ncbi:hypothetical protein ACFY5D_21175 [Paeniglutamicibacter sp. NPDC012692]|uniref:hypothetical protein n=1 Tax=Paeniglutamicibacter sp. NPDC012692 TaxID=3364388 RepID=UPI0036988BC3
MCQRLGVSRASYYRWAQPAGLAPTASRHAQLSVAVQQEFENSDQMAGRAQLTKFLNGQGIKVAAGTVGSIMNEYGLKSWRMRAWKKTTVNDPEARAEHIKNHMHDEHGKRDFAAGVPETRLVGDITYLKTCSKVAVFSHRDRFGHPRGGRLVHSLEYAYAVDH